jgi:hypothetical protein
MLRYGGSVFHFIDLSSFWSPAQTAEGEQATVVIIGHPGGPELDFPPQAQFIGQMNKILIRPAYEMIVFFDKPAAEIETGRQSP